MRITAASDRSERRQALGVGLDNGTVAPVIGQEIPLADAGRAHTAVMASGALGKLVLIPEETIRR